MDARGRLLITRKSRESHEAIAKYDSSFLGASQLPKRTHNLTDARLIINQLFYNTYTIIFYFLFLVSLNPSKAYRHAF